jgi:2-keto-3-deoxy-6-phosphogluconate aldolase
MILFSAPLADEARALVAAGIREIKFPHTTEAVVARYAASLEEARDILIAAGVHFAVSDLMGDF